ncbi:reverse transcriptase domain-containing protein [Vibrio navarrensis]|uniref:reverse transcriptase domain-containing protein n=1 Tax=Vibrio navarrensis TaxID=29495 RepID=UPI001D0479D2|nr:reverse transcriptase domain-containing protein [Vibrio navarrensis]
MDIHSLLTPERVNEATAWLYRQRQHYPANADIWDFRRQKDQQLASLQAQLQSGEYRFSPMQLVNKRDGSQVAIWSSRDALVIKLLSLALAEVLPCHPTCVHIKGHGGGKQSVDKLDRLLQGGQYHFVCRTDIQGYYANIQKLPLLEQLASYVHCPVMMNLLSQFLHYCVESGGIFHTPKKGIPRACSLSPLLAGFQLYPVDKALSDWCKKTGGHYVRFMDDFVILTRSRWQLRAAVRKLNAFFAQHGFRQHPDKTFIGRVAKGFDWLGYQLNENGLCGVAPRALSYFAAKCRQCYAQALSQGLSESQASEKVAAYGQRWQQWCCAGVTLRSVLLAKRCPVGLTDIFDFCPGKGGQRTAPVNL